MSNTQKANRCLASTEQVTTSMSERMRGWIRCTRCEKTFKLGINSKVKNIPMHNEVRETK